MPALAYSVSLKSIEAIFGGRKSFTPSSLFAASEPGGWYDPSDLTTLYQDAAGTTPVTAVEQPVGRVLDKSGRGNHLSQSTAAARPVLSARVNLLTYTETLTNSVWRKDFVTVTAGNLVYPSSGGSDRYVWYSLTGQATGVTYRTVLRVKNGGKNFAYIYNVRANSLFYVNLTTGVTSNVGTNIANLSTSVASDGWIDVSFDSVLTDAQTTAYVFVGPSDAAGSTAVTVNGTDGIYVNKVDLRPANAGVGLPAYQRVGAATDYDAGDQWPKFLKFDGTDDFLQSSTITPGSVDKAQVFAGVRKRSDAAAGVVAEYSNNVGSQNGSFLIDAPDTPAQTDYGFYVRGTIANEAPANGFAAPDQAVLTMQADISAASNRIIARRNAVQTGTSGAASLGTGNFGTYPLYIGRRDGTSLPFNGNLYQLLVRFSAANLDAATITATEAWVNQRTKAF